MRLGLSEFDDKIIQKKSRRDSGDSYSFQYGMQLLIWSDI